MAFGTDEMDRDAHAGLGLMCLRRGSYAVLVRYQFSPWQTELVSDHQAGIATRNKDSKSIT